MVFVNSYMRGFHRCKREYFLYLDRQELQYRLILFLLAHLLQDLKHLIGLLHLHHRNHIQKHLLLQQHRKQRLRHLVHHHGVC